MSPGIIEVVALLRRAQENASQAGRVDDREDFRAAADALSCPTCKGEGVVYRTGRGGIHGGCPAGCPDPFHAAPSAAPTFAERVAAGAQAWYEEAGGDMQDYTSQERRHFEGRMRVALRAAGLEDGAPAPLAITRERLISLLDKLPPDAGSDVVAECVIAACGAAQALYDFSPGNSQRLRARGAVQALLALFDASGNLQLGKRQVEQAASVAAALRAAGEGSK